MPTFSAMQLDRLLESKAATTTTTPLKNDNKNLLEDSFPKLERRNTTSSSPLRLQPSFQTSVDIPPSHPNLRRRNSISDPSHTVRPPLTPALYTTPEPTPLPVSPTSSFPPSSPFLINHKRRGPRLSKSFSEQNVALTEKNAVEIERTRSLSEENVVLEQIEEVNGDNVAMEVKVEKSVGEGGEVKGGESEDFYDPQESMSYSSSNEVEEYGGERSAKAITPLGEFYDAWEGLILTSISLRFTLLLCGIRFRILFTYLYFKSFIVKWQSFDQVFYAIVILTSLLCSIDLRICWRSLC